MCYTVHNTFINYKPTYGLSGAITTLESTHRTALPYEQFPKLLRRIEDYIIGSILTSMLTWGNSD